jgi:hypothetical protein
MSRPIAKSTRRVASRLWISIPLLALAARGNGVTLSGVPAPLQTNASSASPSGSGTTASTPGSESTSSSPGSSSASTASGSSPTATSSNTSNGGGGSGTFYWTIAFTVSGLDTGASLVVLLNGTYGRVITKNLSPPQGWYLFAPGVPASFTGLPLGNTYSISVGTQPAGDTCTVTNGSGTLVAYTAPPPAVITCTLVANASGSSTVIHASAVPSISRAVIQQAPPARQGAASFTDSSGNLWLFGGAGEDATGTAGHFNDLWKFSPDAGGWSRAAGSDSLDSAGHYGTRGVSSPTNVPSARVHATSWTDLTGDLWLFGGQGSDAAGTLGTRSDLWKYSLSTRQWTWVSGSAIANSPGLYGVQNAPATANRPGARSNAASWIDSAGTLWLFGGFGIDSTGAAGILNDLWQFTPSTGTWTWVSGSIMAAAGSAV